MNFHANERRTATLSRLVESNQIDQYLDLRLELDTFTHDGFATDSFVEEFLSRAFLTYRHRLAPIIPKTEIIQVFRVDLTEDCARLRPDDTDLYTVELFVRTELFASL